MPTQQLEGKTQALGLIGGIGLTEVHVYAQRPAPDGKFSGCPHVHAVTDEGYFVLQGTGSVEFHDAANGYRELSLEPGQYVHFPPLMMHRLISDGDLIILGMMGNAGLAERGEARIYFGKDVDDNPDRFNELQTLPQRTGLEGALARRDAAVTAYMNLMRLWQDDRPAYFTELQRFIACHCQAMAHRSNFFSSRFITDRSPGPRQLKSGSNNSPPSRQPRPTSTKVAADPNPPSACAASSVPSSASSP